MTKENKLTLVRIGIVVVILFMIIGAFVGVYMATRNSSENTDETTVIVPEKKPETTVDTNETDTREPVTTVPEKEPEEEPETTVPEEKPAPIEDNVQKIAKPVLDGAVFEYNGKEQGPDEVKGAGFSKSKDSVVSAIKAGKYSITYQLNDKKNTVWEDGTTSDISFTWQITQREVGLQWSELNHKYDGKPHSAKCVATNVIKGDTCTVNLKNNSITEIGEKTVTAVSLSNNNYKLPKDKTAILSVAKDALGKITSANKVVEYDGKYHSIDNVVCETKGCVIEYKSVGSSNYSTKKQEYCDAGTYEYEWRVTRDGYATVKGKNTLTITKSKTAAYTKKDFDYDGTTHNGVAGEFVKITGSASAKDAGKYIAYLTPDKNHTWKNGSSSQISVEWTIRQRVATLEWGTLSWTYDGKDHSTTCRVSNLISGDKCNVTLQNNSIRNAGTKTVTATALSNNNYKLPSNVSATLTVNNAKLATWKRHSAVYDGQYHQGVTGEHVKIEGEITARDVGTYKVTLTPEENYAWENGSTEPITLSWPLTCRVAELEWGTLTWTYDGLEHSTTCKVKNLVAGDECVVTLEWNSITNVGGHPVYAVSLSNRNYKMPVDNMNILTVVNATFADSSLMSRDKVVTYDGLPHSIDNVLCSVDGASVMYARPSADESRPDGFSVNKPDYVNVGTYKIFWQVSREGYETKEGYNTLTIKPSNTAAYSISDYIYDGKAHFGVAGNGIEISNTDTKINVGTYTAKVKPMANFTWPDGSVDEREVSWAIKPKTISVVWGQNRWVYDEKWHYATCKFDGLVGNDVIVPVISNNGIKNVGTKKIKIDSIDNSNYILPDSEATTFITIDPAAFISTNCSDKCFTYDAEYHSCGDVISEPTYDKVLYSVDGINYTDTKPQFKNAGSYKIYWKVEKEGYEAFISSSLVDILKRKAEVSWGPIEFEYTGTKIPVECSVTNLLPGDTGRAVLDVSEIGPEPGEYEVKLIGLSGCDDNYYCTPETKTFIIKKPKTYTLTTGAEFNTLCNLGAQYIKFVDSQIPQGAFDVSDVKDGSVMAWTEMDGNGIKTLYVAAENHVIYANENMAAAFKNYNTIGYSFGNLDSSKAVSMAEMFSGNKYAKSFGTHELDVSNVTDMSSMFYNCSNTLSLDLSTWNTKSVTNTRSMFRLDNNIITIYVGKGWDMSKVEHYYGQHMFNSSVNDEGALYAINSIYGQSGTHGQQQIDVGAANYESGLLTYYDGTPYGLVAGPEFNSYIPDGTTEVRIGDYHNIIPNDIALIDFSVSKDMSVVGWSDNGVLYVTSVNGGKLAACGSMYNMFYEKSGITSVTIDNMDASRTFNLSYMFKGCTGLSNLYICDWNTNSADRMNSMFAECTSLEEFDLTRFDVSNVKNMTSMFAGCTRLRSLNVSNWNTEKVESMALMFNGCSSLTMLDLSSWDTKSVADTRYMFTGDENLEVILVGKKWDISRLDSFYSADMIRLNSGVGYYAPLPKLIGQDGTEIAGTSTVAHYGEGGMLTYYNGAANALVTGPKFNSLMPTTAKKVYFGDYHSNIPDTGVIDLSLKADGSVLGWLDGDIFYVTSADGNAINTSGSMTKMFYNRSGLEEVRFNNINGAEVVCINYIFYGCSKLMAVDFSGLKNGNVISANSAFAGCSSLVSVNLSRLNLSKMTGASRMFYDCTALTSVDFGDNVLLELRTMDYMFYMCRALKVIDLENRQISKVYTIRDMAYYCTSLEELHVSDWNTQNLTDAYYAFAYCPKLKELDLCGWNTSSLQNSEGLFAGLNSVERIYVGDGWDMSNVAYSSNMFSQNNKLVGGTGVKYTTVSDKELANYDTGLLTYKAYRDDDTTE